MKKSIIYSLVFLFIIGIGSLKAQKSNQSELKDDQSATAELLPGEVPELENKVIAVNPEHDPRRPGGQIEISKEEATPSESQETLLPGEHPIVESTNVVLQDDPKLMEQYKVTKEEVTISEEEVIYLPGEHPIVEVNNSEINHEEIRSLEVQKTPVSIGENATSKSDQPEGEKSSAKVINYRTIQGPQTQPEPVKSGNVTNYRTISGPNTQPEGKKPDVH